MEAHYCKIKITRDGKVVVTSKMLHFVESQQKLPKFGFRSHTTALWPMEQSWSISFPELLTAHARRKRRALERTGCNSPQIADLLYYTDDVTPK